MTIMCRNFYMIVVLLLFFVNYLEAQMAPVSSQTIIIPPYSVRLMDYVNAPGDRFIVYIKHNDLSVSHAEIKLKMIIEGQTSKLETSVNAKTPVFTINGGETLKLSNTDFVDYFKAGNINFYGITKDYYLKTGTCLPEGSYKIYFEVYEVNSNIKVSAFEAPAIVLLLLNETPLLLFPANNKIFTTTECQSLNFQWMPRHLQAGADVEYKLQIVELPLNYKGSLYNVFENFPLFFECITSTSNYLYAQPNYVFQSGYTYAYRVKAEAKSMDGLSFPFKNNGYSEIFLFKCQEPCNFPRILSINTQRPNCAEIQFENSSGGSDIIFEYRKKSVNGSSFLWNTVAVDGNQLLLSKLNLETVYEYRMYAVCALSKSEYAAIDTFSTTTIEAASAICYQNNENQQEETALRKAENLKKGDLITAAGNTLKIVELENSNGRFSGKASSGIKSFYNVGIMMKFDNITINENNQLINGFIEGIYDEDDSYMLDVDEILEGGDDISEKNQGHLEVDIQLSVSIDAQTQIIYNAEENAIVIIKEGVEVLVLQLKNKKLPLTLKDNNGNIFQIDKDGYVTQIAQKGSWEYQASLNNLSSKKDAHCSVIFEVADKAQYAFDKFDKVFENSLLIKYAYQKWQDDYLVYKAIAPGKVDYIAAKIQNADTSLSNDSIIFITNEGVLLNKSKKEDNLYILTLVGGTKDETQEILAIYPGKDSTRVFGKFILVAYSPKKINLKLIHVNKSKLNELTASDVLRQVYAPVLVDYIISSDTFTYNENPIKVEGSALTARYTDDMKALYRAYFLDRDWDSETYYVFICNSSASADVKGVMPRGRQYAFIFEEPNKNDQKSMALTLAHELGHGIFALKHTYDDAYQIPRGKANGNLMDEPCDNGILCKWQWAQIHDPGVVIGIFERDEDGFRNVSMEEYLRDIKKSIHDNSEFIATFAGRITKYKMQTTVKIGDYTFHDLMLNVGHTYGGKTSFALRDVTPSYSDEYRTWEKEKYIIYYENLEIIAVSKKERENLKEYFNSYSACSLENVMWVSQKNEQFKNETCYPDRCCCVASNYILQSANVRTNRSQQIIINTTNTTDCSVLVANENFEKAVSIIKRSLKIHKLPIIVGVNHFYIKNKAYKCSKNSPSHTNHYIVIVGCDYDKDKQMEYFRFYEVGTNDINKGTSIYNRLYIDETRRMILGSTLMVPDMPFYYKVTEIRKNIGQKYE